MIFKHLRDEIDAIIQRDPAARSRFEVVLCYPGFHALLFHRMANRAWRANWHLLGRFLSHVGRVLTGIEIHPGATIGKRLFIDHGVGVVIGETAEIGNDVTLYQGVTLGGTSLNQGKRHPTLEDGVIVGGGAKVLGPIVVGAGARVGSNAVVLKAVPPGVTVVGIPAREVSRERKPEFSAYAASGDLPDPVARALDALANEVATLRQQVVHLEARLAVANEQASPPEGGAAPLSIVGPSGERTPLEIPRKGAIR